MKIEHEKIWNALKEVLREKLIVLSAYIKKKKSELLNDNSKCWKSKNYPNPKTVDSKK